MRQWKKDKESVTIRMPGEREHSYLKRGQKESSLGRRPRRRGEEKRSRRDLWNRVSQVTEKVACRMGCCFWVAIGYGREDITFGLKGTSKAEFRGKKANCIGLMEVVSERPQIVHVDPPW